MRGNEFKSFKEIMDYCTMRRQLDSPAREYGGKIHLSEVTVCSRQYLLKSMGFKRPLATPEGERVFQLGHMHHNYIQSLLVEYGFCDVTDVEYPISSDEFDLCSNADIASIWIDNVEYVVDIKTVSSDKIKNCTCPDCKKKFKVRPSAGTFQSLKKPQPKHIDQVTLYIYFINRIRAKYNQPPIRFGKIVYINKSGGQYSLDRLDSNWHKRIPVLMAENPDIKIEDAHFEADIIEFDFEYNPLHADNLVAKIERVASLIKHEVIPNVDPDEVNEFYCKSFCSYYQICKNMGS